MIDYDNNSKEAHLVFDLCFPFMKHDEDGNSIVNNDYNMYQCADIAMNLIKTEMHRHDMTIPEHYEKAHMIIICKLIEKKEAIKI